MSGNASRYSHQRARRYSQTILSQGAMVTDADQREGQAIGLRNTLTLGNAAIRTGVPQTDGIVRWEKVEAPSAHKVMIGIRPGRVVADGHVGEVRATEGGTLAGDPGFDLLHQQADLLDAPELTDTVGPLVCYCDLWHRHVGPAEDPRLTDPAFLAAETATRTELVAQLKLSPLTGAPTDAELKVRVEDSGLPRFGDFRLTAVDFAAEIVEPDACDPCATTLEDPNQDAGNDLFRLEVHLSPFNTAVLDDPEVPAGIPDAERIVLKWSRDNGSVEVPVSAADALLSDSTFDTAVFELTRLPAEQRLGLFTDGMTDRLATLHSRVDIEAAIAGAPADAMLRIWDGAVDINLDVADLDVQPVGTLSAEGTITKAGDTWTLEIELGGLALTLEAGDLVNVPYILPGDAWSVEIREYAEADGEKLIWTDEPVEIEHFYCFVGVIEDGDFRNEDEPDMRARAFPALTELDALDIAYDNSRSEAEASTVQGALDLLFARPAGEGHDCICTYCVDPGEDLVAELSRIAEEVAADEIRHALICIPAGRHFLAEPVAFKAPAGITLRGAGRELTVIELGKAFTDSGMIGFNSSKTVRVEEMSFVGDLVIDDADSVPFVIGVHDVADFTAWRVSMRVAREGDRLSHGIRVTPLEGEDSRTAVTVRDSIFRLGAQAQAIGIWRGAASLTLEGNEFRALNAETFGGSGKLSAANDFIARTSVDRRTPAREAQIADGFFAAYPGNSEFLLNFTDVPPAVRPAAERYWVTTLRMLRNRGRISEPVEFAQVQADLFTINVASSKLVEAEIMAADAGSGAAGVSVDDLRGRPVLGALTGGGPRPLLADFGAGPVVGNFTVFQPILAAGGSVEAGVQFDGDLSANDQAALDLVTRADSLIANGLTVAEFIGRVGPILDLVARDFTNPGPPTWGVFCFTLAAIPAIVTGNRFVDLDVAVDLAANETGQSREPFTVPRMAMVSDNVVRRVLRLNRVLPPEWGPDAGDIFFGRQPITLTNYEDVTVENNNIGQVRPDDMDDGDYAQIYGRNFPAGMSSFSAISLNARMGPKVRSIGNSSFSFRHCIHVNCLPWKPRFDPDDPPANFWVFRENSALPLFRGEGGRQHAVELAEATQGEVNSTLHLAIADNWLPNPKFLQ